MKICALPAKQSPRAGALQMPVLSEDGVLASIPAHQRNLCIQALERHKNISATQRYIEYSESKLRSAIEFSLATFSDVELRAFSNI